MLYNFEDDDIVLNLQANDKVDAIKKASQVLIDKGKITEDYIDEILASLDQFGPYFVLAPGMAFAHSKPSASVLKTGLSIATLKEPVNFDHDLNDPVFLVCVIASVNSEEHVELLRKLATFLSKPENIEELKLAKDESQKMHILQNLNRMGE